MPTTRRDLLKAGTALGSVPLLYSGKSYAADYTNQPGPDLVKFGFTVPQTGAFADEGADELRAFELAVDHINGGGDGGMLNTLQPSALQGNGILGRQVEFVVADTETRPDVATENARALIDNEGVSMIAGGSSSGVAIALQTLCQEKGVVFMAGLTHSNDTTGIDGVKNGFRHHINVRMSATALASHLVAKYPGPRNVYYLTADYNWGTQNENGFRSVFEANGWETTASVRTPLAQSDFTSYVTPVIESGADTLIMSHYGANMVNMAAAIDQSGLKDLQVNGKPFVVGLPLFSDLMARGAGAAGAGIYGTANWHSSLADSASEAFKTSYFARYNRMPSGAAHTCYVQTLLYADACERVGTFDPCRVIAALQDHQFSGLGNGECFYRAQDHQCFKDVLVVKGNSASTSDDDLLTIDGVIPRSTVEYSADTSDTSHGQCFNGVESVIVNETSATIGQDDGSGSTSGSVGSNSGGGGGGGSFALAGLAALGAGLVARRRELSKESRLVYVAPRY